MNSITWDQRFHPTEPKSPPRLVAKWKRPFPTETAKIHSDQQRIPPCKRFPINIPPIFLDVARALIGSENEKSAIFQRNRPFVPKWSFALFSPILTSFFLVKAKPFTGSKHRGHTEGARQKKANEFHEVNRNHGPKSKSSQWIWPHQHPSCPSTKSSGLVRFGKGRKTEIISMLGWDAKKKDPNRAKL